MRVNRNFALLSLLFLAACGPKKSNTTVPPLAPEMAEETNKRLAQGQPVTPAEAMSGVIAPAIDKCAAFRQSLPADWFQELLEVPEDPSQPDGQKIRVFYYGKIHPGTVPTIYFNGGPGGHSRGSYSVLVKTRADKYSVTPEYSDITKTSFVFMDQRGTGCSDFYPQGSSREILARLRFYGTRGIVADAEQIRARIWPNQKWIAMGQSYGAFILHRYLHMAPEALKAGFAHANVISPDPFERLKSRIASQARVMQYYFESYPEDRELFAKLKSYLTPDRCFQSEDKKQKACGLEVIDEFTGILAFRDSWLSIHQWLGSMVTREGFSDDALSKFVAIYYFTPANPLGSRSTAISVINWVDRNTAPYTFENCKRVETELLAQGVMLDQVPVNECASILQLGQPQTSDEKEWNIYIQGLAQDLMTLESFKDALLSHPEVPFYLYSGKNDPLVPVETFAPELKVISGISNVHYTNFSGSGHDGFYSEPRIWQDLIRESTLLH